MELGNDYHTRNIIKRTNRKAKVNEHALVSISRYIATPPPKNGKWTEGIKLIKGAPSCKEYPPLNQLTWILLLNNVKFYTEIYQTELEIRRKTKCIVPGKIRDHDTEKR